MPSSRWQAAQFFANTILPRAASPSSPSAAPYSATTFARAGTTAPAKTGAGSSIGTLVASSLLPLNGTPTSSIPSSVRRITYATTWAAGTATANGIAEVALVNQSIGTQTAAPASSTIARALLSPAVNKGSADSLTVTWHHDIGTA